MTMTSGWSGGDHATQPRPEEESRLRDDGVGNLVASAGRMLQSSWVKGGWCGRRSSVARERTRQRMVLLEPHARAVDHARPGRQGFDAARRATTANVRAPKIDRDMATLARDTVFAVVDLLVDDDAVPMPVLTVT